jgi:hypothetical protein
MISTLHCKIISDATNTGTPTTSLKFNAIVTLDRKYDIYLELLQEKFTLLSISNNTLPVW